MGDLYSGLILKKFHKNEFWGNYSILNSLHSYSDSALLRIQTTLLMNLEQRPNSKFKNIENFINQADKKLDEEEELLNSSIESQLYSRLIKILNAGLQSNKDNATRAWYKGLINEEQRNKKIDQQILEAQQILDELKINNSLKAETMNILEKQLKDTHVKGYTQIKANLAEKLMVDLLNKKSGWKAIQTGQIVDKIGQSLIEDAMVFSKDALNKNHGNNLFYYTIENGKKQKHYGGNSLKDFFEQVEALNGTYTIELTDPLYNLLKKSAVLSAQTKSGQFSEDYGPQRILNKAKRNKISLYETNKYKEYYKIWELFKLQKKDNEYFKSYNYQNSQTLQSLVNYSLSRAITKTALTSNEVYFTESGIFTASQWMNKYKYILKFQSTKELEPNRINRNFLYTQRQYALNHIKT